MGEGRKKGGSDGGNPLNFKVVGGTTEPTNPKENTIWVYTHVGITSWHFGAEEPNVCNITPHQTDMHLMYAPHVLHAGDILNFTVPNTIGTLFEAITISDETGGFYRLRNIDGTALTSWNAGTKIGVVISNNNHPINGFDGVGTAYLMSYGSYYHAEGTVWISTGTSSPVAFNALQKNNITVYPISAKLFSGGMWWDAEAKNWQGGKWVDWWDGTLYDNGDEYVNVTGGWTYATNDNGYVLTKNATSMSMQSTGSVQVVAYHNYPVDITRFKTVSLNVNYSDSHGGLHAHLVAAKISGFNMGDNSVAKTEFRTSGMITLNVENLTGKHYIGVVAPAIGAGYTISVTINAVKLIG